MESLCLCACSLMLLIPRVPKNLRRLFMKLSTPPWKLIQHLSWCVHLSTFCLSQVLKLFTSILPTTTRLLIILTVAFNLRAAFIQSHLSLPPDISALHLQHLVATLLLLSLIAFDGAFLGTKDLTSAFHLQHLVATLLLSSPP